MRDVQDCKSGKESLQGLQIPHPPLRGTLSRWERDLSYTVTLAVEVGIPLNDRSPICWRHIA